MWISNSINISHNCFVVCNFMVVCLNFKINLAARMDKLLQMLTKSFISSLGEINFQLWTLKSDQNEPSTFLVDSTSEQIL